LILPQLAVFATAHNIDGISHRLEAWAMHRRSWIRQFMLAIASLPLSGWLLAEGQRAADLSETLRFGLKCRRPVEFEFVDLVVSKVDNKELPRELVLSMFDYARKKRPHQPFPYFEAGMKKRAEAIGVDL
jgi:hypothetical protein